VTSTATPRGRHRRAEPVRPPALLPRSATVVAAAVGAVLVLGVQERAPQSAPRPHPDLALPALQPVIPEPGDGRPAAVDPVPAGLTGRSIAGAHATGSASVSALDAVAATQPPRGVAPESLFAA
jgi:hypothetical protein